MLEAAWASSECEAAVSPASRPIQGSFRNGVTDGIEQGLK